MTEQNTATLNIPPHLQIFAEALRPAIRSLRGWQTEHRSVVIQPVDYDYLQKQMDLCHGVISCVGYVCTLMMEEIVGHPDIEPSAIYRHVGRVEGMLLDPLIKADREFCYPHDPELQLPFLLWATVRRNILAQFLAWLTQISDALSNPEAACQSDICSREDGIINLSFTLTLTMPPEMDALHAWVADRYGVVTTCNESRVMCATPQPSLNTMSQQKNLSGDTNLMLSKSKTVSYMPSTKASVTVISRESAEQAMQVAELATTTRSLETVVRCLGNLLFIGWLLS